MIFIYLIIGVNADSQLLSNEETATTRRVTFFCDDKNDHLLIPLIQQYISQSKMSKIAFCGVPHRFSSIIGNFISDNNLGKYRVSSFQQLELDKEAFEKNRKQIKSSFSSGDYFIILKEKKCSILSFQTLSFDLYQYLMHRLSTISGSTNQRFLYVSLFTKLNIFRHMVHIVMKT